MNAYKKSKIERLKILLKELQDEVLDEYNKGSISKSEMENILLWTNKMISRMVKELESD